MHSGSERPLQPAPMSSQLLSLSTSQPFQCLPLTDAVRDFIRLHGEREGAVSISGLHTTTALIVNEMEERLLMDLEHWLDQLASASASWKHNDLDLRPDIPADEPRNAHAHLQALVLGNQVMVPVTDGEPVLGTYQDVILVELDGPRQRRVSLQWLSA